MGKDNQLDMLLRHGRRLQVGDCEVDLALNEIRSQDRSTRLTPKAAAVLEVLLYTAGQPVSRERLLAEAWRGEFPTEDVVTHAIGELRRAFGDDTRAPTYIRTLARVGYALVAPAGPLRDVPATADAAPEPETAATRSRRLPWLAAALLLAVVAAAGGWWLPAGRDAPGSAPLIHAPLLQPDPVTSLPGGELFPALSPDASLMAFSADPEGTGLRVYLQVPGADRAARRFSDAPADREVYPVFSPDGRELMLQRILDGSCSIIVASVLGGGERVVGECSPRLVMHLAWAPDGKALLVPWMGQEQARLHRLDLATGALVPLAYPTAPGAGDVQARYSPDGSQIALRRGPMPHSDLYVMGADGRGLRRVTSLHAQMAGFDWTPDGRSLVFSSDHEGQIGLFRVSLADGSIRPLGVPRAWWPDIASLRDELVFMRDASSMQVAELVLDGKEDLEPRLLAPSSRSNYGAVYAPDDQRVAMVSDRTGRDGLYVVDGAATRRLVEHADGRIVEPHWSADGRELLYVLRGRGSRLFVVDVGSGRGSEATPPGHTVMSATFSPDGAAIVFTSDRSGLWELWWLDRGEGAGPPRQLTRSGGRHAAFVDARRLVYAAGGDAGPLRMLDLATGTSQPLGVSIGYWNQHGWQVDADGMHALLGSDDLGIYRRGWAETAWTLVEPLAATPLGEFRLALDRPRARALVTVTPQEEGDIFRLSGATLDASH